jgi:CRP/FNR family transcriptional regulator, cyclic AMP receptor protein
MSNAEAARIPILAVLKQKDRDAILKNARQRTYAPGEAVVKEGDGALNLFLVVTGRARVESHASGPVGTIGPGDFFGELGVLEDHGRTASVVAEDELTCILLPAWEFRALLDAHPEMAIPMLHALIRRQHGLSTHDH